MVGLVEISLQCFDVLAWYVFSPRMKNLGTFKQLIKFSQNVISFHVICDLLVGLCLLWCILCKPLFHTFIYLVLLMRYNLRTTSTLGFFGVKNQNDASFKAPRKKGKEVTKGNQVLDLKTEKLDTNLRNFFIVFCIIFVKYKCTENKMVVIFYISYFENNKVIFDLKILTIDLGL